MGFLDKLTGGSGRGSPEERFWQWFARNSDRMAAWQGEQDGTLSDLTRELSKVHKDLMFAFGQEPDGQREFVVSAGGIRSVFPAVQKLVAAAPGMPGWKITAFRPAGELGSVSIGGQELRGEDVWFVARPGGMGIDLSLYVRGLSQQNEKAIGGAAFILLDAALGEYNVGTKIGGIQIKPLPDNPAALGMKPLPDLPDVVEQLCKQASRHP